MGYKLIILPGAEKTLKKLPNHEFLKVDAVILKLAENARPHGYLKLQGVEDTYRIRVGDYRILYKIQDKQLIIEIIRIANRREAYKK